MIKAYILSLWKRFCCSSIINKFFVSLFIILEIFILIICFAKTDYSVTTPGYLEEASNTVSITTDNESPHILTVSVQSFEEVSIIQSWIAKSQEDFDMEIPTPGTITGEDYSNYAITLKRIAINDAVMVAYTKAKEKDSSINLVSTFQGMIIYYISNKENDFKYRDIITQIDGVNITSIESFNNEINKLLGVDRTGGTKNENDTITFTLLRYDSSTSKYSNTPITREVKITKNDSSKLVIGISVSSYYELNGTNSNPSFTISYNETLDAKGSSGGAMLTLSLYSSLVGASFTDNFSDLFIAGTGTIDLEGNIGAIGAIEQKTITCYTKGADIFFVDNNDLDSDGKTDYDKALETCEKYGYDSSFIIPVKTFDDIITALENIGDNNE